MQTSERRLREENEHLRKEAREKNALVDKLTDTDRAVEAGKRAVRLTDFSGSRWLDGAYLRRFVWRSISLSRIRIPVKFRRFFFFVLVVVPQELAALQEELTRMRRKAEDDRRAVAQAELEQTKQASQAREKTRELEGKISALKARLC